MLPVTGTNLALSHFLVIVGMALVILGVAFYWLPVTRVKMAALALAVLGGLTAGVMTPRYGLPCGADMTGWSCPRPLPLPPRPRGTAIRAWTTPRGT